MSFHAEANRLFDSVLDHDGLVQNEAKLELIPSLRKPAENREFDWIFGEAGYVVKPHTWYLGSRIAHDAFLNGHAVRLRIRACATAWSVLGTSWWTTDVPRSVMRLVFLSRVPSAAISGLEAYALTKGEVHHIDSSLVRKIRCMMRGVAHSVDGDDKHRAMTDAAVYRWLCVAPARVELRIRRLRWLQVMMAGLTHPTQPLLAAFGVLCFEGDSTVFDEDGRQTTDASEEDLLELHRNMNFTFVTEGRVSFRDIFTDSGLQQGLGLADLAVLRRELRVLFFALPECCAGEMVGDGALVAGLCDIGFPYV